MPLPPEKHRCLCVLFTAFAFPAAVWAQSGWDQVWDAVRDPGAWKEEVPAAALEDGPPVREGNRVLFRYRSGPGDGTVYLAGNFNGWAQNSGGKITNPRFAMRETGDGHWFRWVELSPGDYAYNYVVEDAQGGFEWRPDPNVSERSGENHSLFTVPVTAADDADEGGYPRAYRQGVSPEEVVAVPERLRVEKVWVRPGVPNAVLINPVRETGGELRLEIRTPLGEIVHTSVHPREAGMDRIPIPALDKEGGYLAALVDGDGSVAGETVLSVVENVADDLRYGFYASYGSADGDYDAKADMLAALHVNAVEFYDYFPAHGFYAPTERHYDFEPFDIRIDAEDVRRKIVAGHGRNILAIAYVAAYAASQSVYEKHPHPMTDEHGVPKVFNGVIMTEEEADRRGLPKWFWIMDIAGGSPWHEYIMEEFRRTLDDSPDNLVSFDGFEIDTYGDSDGARFYAQDSPRNGDLLSDVLRDFVEDVQELTKSVKPHGLVSFNSINEFGSAGMVDVTDFLFMEIWRFYARELVDLVDVCFRNRAPQRQRVVLKIYPADMEPKRESWPTGTLARVLGATMTGGGSLMVVGEPDEENGVMHGLNSLFYPDHTPLRSGNDELVGNYYAHDAMMLGYTHGRNVFNTEIGAEFPGSITRVYAAPDRRTLVVQILRAGEDRLWAADVPFPEVLRGGVLTMPLPGGVAPVKVCFASPDSARYRHPVPVEFETDGDEVRVTIPELRVHGTLVLQY